MLAISCRFGNDTFFFNKKKERPQKYIAWAYMENIDKNDENVISDTLALICCLVTSGHHLNDLNEVLILDAQNKNISRTIKTDEIETYKKYFNVVTDIAKSYNNGNYESFLEDDWGGISGLSSFLKILLFSDCNEMIVADAEDYDEIKNAISKFNKRLASLVSVTNYKTLSPINDNLLLKIKLALSDEIYSKLVVFKM